MSTSLNNKTLQRLLFLYVVVVSFFIMYKKLQEIIDDSEEVIERYETQLKNMKAKIVFCVAHKLEEEARIARVKYHDLDMAIYKWRKQQTALRDLLNAWNS